MSCDDPSKSYCCKISNKTTSTLLTCWVWYTYLSWVFVWMSFVLTFIASMSNYGISAQNQIIGFVTIPLGALIQQLTLSVVLNFYERFKRVESQLNINDEECPLNPINSSNPINQ